MKLAFANNNKIGEDSSGPTNNAWAKTAPISLRNSQQFPSLGESGSLLSDSGNISNSENKENSYMNSDQEVFGSSALDEGESLYVPDVANPLTLRRAELFLFPRYNGLFDPFGSDRLLKTLMALVAEKGTDLGNVPNTSTLQPPSDGNSNENGGRRSRYERIFDSSSTGENQTVLIY